MYITPNNANIYYINLSMLQACPVRDEFLQENIEQPSRNRLLKKKKKKKKKKNMKVKTKKKKNPTQN